MSRRWTARPNWSPDSTLPGMPAVPWWKDAASMGSQDTDSPLTRTTLPPLTEDPMSSPGTPTPMSA
ncbi:hypothetical protein AQ490_24540 [Wenjunlia vitaminophila]|uniref:Uncharacterized protein n=1 Tax=Wenjunlia vitaminophila TaxID=76728 RepID=A0A0T6LR98_WENVI|nr:hypothetical protein AQ490_24540 [Wenjunlia vitaminophila]